MTDRTTHVPVPGGHVTVIQPGADIERSFNWRLKEEAFVRYKSILVQAVDNAPQETAFPVPDNISPNTFIRCIRDARQALLQYPGYDINLHNRLVALGNDWVVSMDPSGTKVWFRKRSTQGRPRVAVQGEISGGSPLKTVLRDCPTAEQAHAICLLLHSRWLNEPFQFRQRLDPALVLALETQYDVAFAYDEQTDVTTLM